MEVTLWKLEQILPYARNARLIPQEAVTKVAASIHEFGWRQPIVVDREGVIICGHARLLAARQLQLEQAPVHVAENLTPAQVRAYRLMDNRSHQETSWDEDLLGLELLDLKDMGFDLELTGFALDEVDSLLERAEGTEALTDVDAVPPLPPFPSSKRGDLWVLGPHRLLCGDATLAGSMDRVLGGRRADIVFTDPPYNVDYRQPSAHPARAGRQIANDDLGTDFQHFLREASRHLLERTEGAIYICMSSSQMDVLKRVFVESGGHWSTFVIWCKNTFTIGRSDYQRQYEPILYGWPSGRQRYWCGARDQGDLWFIDKPVCNDLHPTMKPVELMVRAIGNSSESGATVLDPFGGSGSTMIACHKSGRRGRLIELDPVYVDVAAKRWQDYTGRKAVLEDDGRTFEQVCAERAAGDGARERCREP